MLLDTVHTSPGRVRLRMAGLRHDDRSAHHLASVLRANVGILSASASPVTGTLVVEFGRDLHTAAIRSLVAETLAGNIIAGQTDAPEDPQPGNALVRWVRKMTHPEPTPPAPVRRAVEPSSELWHGLSVQQSMEMLRVGPSGLTSNQAEVRLLQWGPIDCLSQSRARTGHCSGNR